MPVGGKDVIADGSSAGITSYNRGFLFAEAANTMASSAPDILRSLPDSVWATRAMVAIQTFAWPVAFWFKPVCVCVALFWLVYRAYQVLNKPLEELASLLGFDIPLTPVIDLASIKADGAIIHWSLPNGEKQRNRSKLKYEIHLNGMVIETVSLNETAVTITGLQPSSFYVARVALVNEHEFGSRSEPVRFRTKPASTGDCFVVGLDTHETDHDGDKETLPRVRLYRGLKDITPAHVEAAPMVRETSSSGLVPKRSNTGRRSSPAVLGQETKHEPRTEDNDPPEGIETIQQLTERLDAIRRDTDEAERQAKDEEEEEVRLKDELTKERDELRSEVAEKEKASRNLKREVNTLERQNTAAQNERSKQERVLQQKKQDRQKLKNDVIRWEHEAQTMKAAVARIQQDKASHLTQIEREKEALLAKQAEEATQARTLEDAIKDKNSEIKKLERTLRNSSPDGSADQEPNLVQQMQQDNEESRQWNAHRTQLQQQYATSAQKLEAAKRFHYEQARYLESVRAQRRRDEEAAAQQQLQQQQQVLNSPSPATERVPGIRRGDSQRSRRVPSGHSTSESPRLGGFAMSTSSPFANVMAASSPFPSAPFLNIQNGMTIIGPPTGGMTMSDEDRDRLTGGAPMSPGAGADLLPADLFSGETDQSNRQEQFILPGLGALPGLPGIPGPIGPLGAQQVLEREHPGPGPASPASASSRSPSVFASPQASQNNLHIGSPENFMDADRRSVRSNRSGRASSNAAAAGSRFSSMFGIKPRAKTNPADEGPPLGKAQSHSMPRQDGGVPGLDSATRKRNSSISGSFGADIKSIDGASESFADASPAGAAPRRAFGMRSIFGKDKEGGWPSSFSGFGRRPGSPRPGSTHSNELPRPSFDSSRWGADAWSSNDATAGARSSPLSFGPGWNAPVGTQSRWAGSRHPSRRPSVQYGASGPPEDIMEDSDSDVLDPDSEPHLAPIGTKPASKSSTAEDDSVPKLNPAAKDFKSFFGLKSKEKSNPPSNASARESTTPVPTSSSTVTTPHMRFDFEDDSPPNSRKSRDARSMTTTESSIAESGRNSSDLARTPSYDAAYANGSPLVGSTSSTGKESFMAKITRKSSSSKFGLPSFKKSAAARGFESSPNPSVDEGGDGEEAMSASNGSLNGNRARWSSVLKRSGKGAGKKGDAPSVSGQSTEGEEGLGIEE